MKQNRPFRQTAWLLPGLAVKRWFFLIAVGAGAIFIGIALMANLQPVTYSIELLKYLGMLIPSYISGPMALVLGAIFLYFGLKNTLETFSSALEVNGWDPDFLEVLYRRNKLRRGPHIVAIGGGTGLSTLLRGLKLYTNNITAVVTVGDDGGSSGRLREEQGIIPPGDIRNCIAALANEERLITELFQYRFASGDGLQGHSFGNLFLTAMCQVTGDMMTAIKESSKVLNIRGQVLPSTLDSIALVAEMADGTIIEGESAIPEHGGTIKKLRCKPSDPTPLPDVLEAIQRAELIILGPGSLYTSVLPNLLIDEIAQGISNSKAPKVYVANVMTQPGETDGFSVGDHVSAILEHTQYPNMVDAVIVNNWLPDELVAKYRQYNYEPVEVDEKRCNDMGLAIVTGDLIDDTEHKSIRHNPKRLARTIIQWLKKEHPRSAKHVDITPNIAPKPQPDHYNAGDSSTSSHTLSSSRALGSE